MPLRVSDSSRWKDDSTLMTNDTEVNNKAPDSRISVWNLKRGSIGHSEGRSENVRTIL